MSDIYHQKGEAYYHRDCGNRLVEGYCKDCSLYPDIQSVTKGEAFAAAEGDEEFFDRCVIAILGACPELDPTVMKWRAEAIVKMRREWREWYRKQAPHPLEKHFKKEDYTHPSKDCPSGHLGCPGCR